MAHVSSAGSTRNVRDSNPKYYGVKRANGQLVHAGEILVTQKGTVKKPGAGTYLSRNFTIHASVDGHVKYIKKCVKSFSGRSKMRTFVTIEAA